jgi:hypothetical protein
MLQVQCPSCLREESMGSNLPGRDAVSRDHRRFERPWTLGTSSRVKQSKTNWRRHKLLENSRTSRMTQSYAGSPGPSTNCCKNFKFCSAPPPKKRSDVFRIVAPCRIISSIRHFGGTYRLHLQGDWIRVTDMLKWRCGENETVGQTDLRRVKNDIMDNISTCTKIRKRDTQSNTTITT